MLDYQLHPLEFSLVLPSHDDSVEKTNFNFLYQNGFQKSIYLIDLDYFAYKLIFSIVSYYNIKLKQPVRTVLSKVLSDTTITSRKIGLSSKLITKHQSNKVCVCRGLFSR